VSSRRRLRRRSCIRKHRYPTGAVAARAAAAIQARRPATPAPLHAYPCRFCAGWHIGHHYPPDSARPAEGSS
jgi:hypothetical protein